MTNMQAALGLSQLDRIDKFVMHRRECARYTAGLRDLRGLKVPFEEAWARSVFWMYTIAILGGRRTRASLMKRLKGEESILGCVFGPFIVSRSFEMNLDH